MFFLPTHLKVWIAGSCQKLSKYIIDPTSVGSDICPNAAWASQQQVGQTRTKTFKKKLNITKIYTIFIDFLVIAGNNIFITLSFQNSNFNHIQKIVEWLLERTYY